MAFLLILDREHKALWVKNKNRRHDNHWLLPEVEDTTKNPSNLLNVELLAKQAFIPLKSSLIGKKSILDIFHNDQILYLFLCPGKEASEVLFDLTKYRDIQWVPITCIKKLDNYSVLSGKSIIEAYHDILLNDFNLESRRFHIVKNGHRKKEIDDYNQSILQNKKKLLIELKDQYALYHQPIPKAGDYALLNNWKGIPIGVLEITEVTVEPFDKIDIFIKELNGNTDLSSEDLRQKYQKIFGRWCKTHNQKFSGSKLAVLSQFKITHQFKEKKMDYLKIP
jgi:uncharacterized protein YhfF